MSQTITDIEAKLIRALDDKIAQGWTIDPEVSYAGMSCTCCLLGSMVKCRKEVISDNRYTYQGVAACRLNIANLEALELEAGFRAASKLHTDGYPRPNQSSPFYKLGRKLRAIYVK